MATAVPTVEELTAQLRTAWPVMTCCWLGVEPVKIGPLRSNMLLQPPPSPASRARRLSWPLNLIALDLFIDWDCSLRIARLRGPVFVVSLMSRQG